VSWIWIAALRAVSSVDLQVAYGTGFSLWCPAVVFAAGLVAVLHRSPNGVEGLPQHSGRASARLEREPAAGGVEIASRAGALVFVPAGLSSTLAVRPQGSSHVITEASGYRTLAHALGGDPPALESLRVGKEIRCAWFREPRLGCEESP
jgi:hypothetical protein